MRNEQTLVFGAIADDVTGATDLAAYIARSGLKTVQYFGVPSPAAKVPSGVQCIVIALKTRSIDPSSAVTQSRAAYEWLRQRNVEDFYFKYCSTFDSTSRGNIGPVLDALTRDTGEAAVVVAPSAPENERTVYQGRLFVGPQLLEESPLKDHPINPMRESHIPSLLSAQSGLAVQQIPWQTVRLGAQKVAEQLTPDWDETPSAFVVDAITDADLDTIAQAIVGGRHRLSSGSAGLGAAVARLLGGTREKSKQFQIPPGKAIVLSGSCSAATYTQVAHYRAENPAVFLDPLRLARNPSALTEVIEFVRKHIDEAPMVYATAAPEVVASAQAELGADVAAKFVEEALGSIAKAARELGVTRFVSAGGESSGAVAAALGIKAVTVGVEVAPGVPWCLTEGEDPIALILKSGNFGGPDFFSDALGSASGFDA